MDKLIFTFITWMPQEDGSVEVIIPASMVEDFKLMVKKGTNCSPNMHPDIRDFTDRVFSRDHLMEGNMLQGSFMYKCKLDASKES